MRLRFIPLIALQALLPLGIISPPASAAIFNIDLSPLAGALNLGSTTYTQDHAVGLAAANESGQPASPATGNEVGAGISYDNIVNLLSFDVAYGSAFGFVDLTGAFTNVHFHAPGPVNFPAVNTPAGVSHGLAVSHIPSGPLSGRLTGTVLLTAAQEINLFDNEIYLNIHSIFAGAGEIRGQLVAVGAVPLPAALPLFGTALAGMGFIGWRRKRKAAA